MSNKTESSLPQEAAQVTQPSTPRLTQYSSSPMEDDGPKSASAVSPDPQQTPDRPRHKRVNTDETERPASAQQHHDDSEEPPDLEAENDVLKEEDVDPAAQIDDFNWNDLHQRYHDKIKECNRDEEKLMQEWASLMEYFQVWANSGHEHETDRTFKRLQTRTMYVQKEENDLEERRNHYVNVVRAFESALNLLKQNTLFRG